MRTTRLVAAVGLLTVALVACSGGSDNSEGSGAAPVAAPQDKGAGTRESDAQPSTGKDGAKQPSIARAIVRTGSLTVQVKDVEGDNDVLDARQQVSSIVSGLRGVVASEMTGDNPEGTISRAELTVRIPSGSYDTAVRRLTDEIGTVKLLKQSAEDVTEQVVDVNSRIATQRAGLARMRGLLAKAKSVAEIITVEAELTRREADLESLLARQKTLADQTELATLTVVLLEPAAPKPPPSEDRSGFLHGLSNGWKAFSSTVSALATAAGALLPFLLTLTVLGLPTWLLLRRHHRPAETPPA